MVNQTLRYHLAQLRHRLLPLRGGTLGREQGQALLRVAIAVAGTVYLIIALDPFTTRPLPFWLWICVAIIAYSSVILLLTLRANESSPRRHIAGNVIDIAATTYVIAQTGEAGVPFFAVYLWVTIGNGFRFGIPALMVSAILSVIGFGVVISVSELWQQNLSLAGGVLFTLFVIPLYSAHLIRMLNAALRRAKEASAAKSQFLARMSHELRTPLSGILNTADLLRGSRRLSPEERSLLDTIEDSVNVSQRQIDNVLDFSKLEAGKLILEKTDLDLHTLLNGTASMVRPAASQKRLQFLVRISPDVPYQLIGDSHHLRAILLNLFSNAVKFTEQGAVWLDVTKKEDDPQRVTVRFEVRDTGIGISPEAQEQIFTSFVQEDSSTTRRYGGTGLGTTIAKQIVELMGGRIGVDSVKGRGSTFWFEIPFEPQAGTEAENNLPADGRVIMLSEDPKRVKPFQQILPEQLAHSQSVDEAIEVLTRTIRLGNPVHMVLVDETMAIDPDGKHICTDLCEKAYAANVPMILITDDPPMIERLREWGYSAVLPGTPESWLVHNVLHASPSQLFRSDENLVTVAPWHWTGSEGVRPRILVADDNRTNLMITRRILEQANFEVDAVEAGDEALERLYAGGYRLALLDMHMPGLDGTSVIRQYRLMRPRSPLPIIMLTANASFEAQQESAEVGANAYLAKPVKARQLLDEVKLLLDETQVEVLPFADQRRRSGSGEIDIDAEVVLDISVLAELDRIYSDPRELAHLVQEYEREGGEILQRIAEACRSHNHPAFCDAVHALKSNAANVGARRLMAVCSEAGVISIVEFNQYRARFLARLQEGFTGSLAALRELARSASSDGHEKSTG